MQNNALFKSGLVAATLLLVASCSSTPDRAAETSSTPPAKASKAEKPKAKSWRPPRKKHTETARTPVIVEPRKETQPDPAPVAITDVWDRIRSGFQISDYETLHADTQQHLRWFIDHPDYVDRVVERARPYLYHIVEEVSKRGMPLEVALLPVVESGFKPHAYSPSHAAGLWQFIPGTGKVYGLDQNWWYDGRRDVVQSTRAALDYLEKLHNDFGDWQLALAAYNCGEGTVGRAIKRNQAAGKPTDFWSLDLPTETSAYVPKLMAVSHMVKFPERYDISLSPVENKAYIGVVDIGSQIDLAVAAEMAQITEDELHQLNPAFNRWATSPHGPHQLVLPLDKIDGFKLALAELPANKRVQWARHKIRRGESLSVIATNYNTTVAVVKQANNLRNNQIRAGHHLLIPVASGQSGRLAAAAEPAQGEGQKQVYTVRSGDTWWDIARQHGLDVQTLADWNQKTAQDTLQPGQELVLWSQPEQRKSVSYTIKNGDSLWAISRKFNVSVAQVREWNGLSDRAMLQPGQNLRLYLEET